MEKESKIYIAGHRGLVGSAIVRCLKANGYNNLVFRTHAELDLISQQAVNDFFSKEKPDYVILAAAKVGGIQANNTYRADFIYDNIMIQTNVIHAAYVNRVTKLLFLGSSCIYPKFAEQPIKEDSLLTGFLEPSNEPYAIAKIAGIKMCESYNRQYGTCFISAMPTNMYGPGDNYDLENSHVLPALIRKIHEAKENGSKIVEIWGSGTPLREFLYSDDLAKACLFLLENCQVNDLTYFDEEGSCNSHINVGSSKEISIKDLAQLIKKVIGYEGEFVFNTSKPDGTPRKLMDSAKLTKLGWKPEIELEEGIAKAYQDFLNKTK